MPRQAEADLLKRILDLQMDVRLRRQPDGRFVVTRALSERFPYFEKMRPSDQAVTLWTGDTHKAKHFTRDAIHLNCTRLYPLGDGDFAPRRYNVSKPVPAADLPYALAEAGLSYFAVRTAKGRYAFLLSPSPGRDGNYLGGLRGSPPRLDYTDLARARKVMEASLRPAFDDGLIFAELFDEDGHVLRYNGVQRAWTS